LGHAHSEQQPLYHQHFAEIMAGRIPHSQTQSKMPKDLRFCLLGKSTAKEINWVSAL
jgi:hypothetical protein